MKRYALFAIVAAASLARSIDVASQEEHAAAHKAKAVQAANLTRTTVSLRDQQLVISTFEMLGDGSNGETGTVQPGVAVWDPRDRLIADRQINLPPSGTFTTATSDHDEPALARLADGSMMVVYGAASTYAGSHPPAAWQCLGNEYCEPFKWIDSSQARGSGIPEAFARAPERLLPSIGLSEASTVTIGDATIIAGQQQPNSRAGQAGAQGYVVLHAGSSGASFDTSAGAWPFASSQAPSGDGLQTITLAPSDDAYADFGVVSASPGNATIALALDGASCVQTIASNGDAAAIAQRFADDFDRACSALSGRLSAMQVAYDPTMRVEGRLLAPAIVGLVARGGDPSALPPTASVRLTCTGAVTCGSAKGMNMLNDVRGSGLHRHYLFGGVAKDGPYVYALMDIEQVTGSWYGAAHSGLALALACFRTSEPRDGVTVWSDCAGMHAFTVRPGVRASALLHANSPYLIGAPLAGYANGMQPYIFGTAMSDQPPANGARGYPVVSAESAALLPDGNLMIVHGCQRRDGASTVCYALLDTHADRTRSAGVVEAPVLGGSLASVALRANGNGLDLAVLAGEGDRWACGARGVCLLFYRYNAAAHSWHRRSFSALGGDENAGFPGTVAASENGFAVQYRRHITGGYADLHVLEEATP